jgi:hypothetical protein
VSGVRVAFRFSARSLFGYDLHGELSLVRNPTYSAFACRIRLNNSRPDRRSRLQWLYLCYGTDVSSSRFPVLTPWLRRVALHLAYPTLLHKRGTQTCSDLLRLRTNPEGISASLAPLIANVCSRPSRFTAQWLSPGYMCDIITPRLRLRRSMHESAGAKHILSTSYDYRYTRGVHMVGPAPQYNHFCRFTLGVSQMACLGRPVRE